MAEDQVPSQHQAMVYDAPGSISTKLETIDTPKPGVGEVLVSLTHSGVCHSDLGVMTNSWSILPAPTSAGQVGGHEGVGTVAALGSGTEKSGLKIGDRVGIKWVASCCGNCTACLSGADACCSSYTISGYYTPGTFQQYALAPAHYVTPIPDGLSSDLAAPLLCGGVTVYSALKKANAQAGDSVVVAGAGGGLGHLAVQIGARGMGLRIIGLDSGSKEKLVMESGAEEFIDITKYSRDDAGGKQLAEDVKKLTPEGLGATAVIVCTAANAAYAQGLSFLRFRGTLVCVGIPEGAPVPIPAFPGPIVAQELRIVGSAVGNRKDAIETMNLAARGVVKTHFVVEPMSNLTNIFERMHNAELQGRVVIDLSTAK